jgi:cell division protein FtsB
MTQSLSRLPGTDSGLPKLRPRPRQSPWRRRGLLFLACALAANALIGERGLAETLRVRKQLQQMTVELAEMRRENRRLAEYARRLASDPRTIEGIARGELGLIRKGEVLVLVKDVPAR